MKNNKYALLVLLASLCLAFGSPTKPNVTLTAQIANCQDELGLYQFDGIGFKLLESVKASENDIYTFKVNIPETTVLYVGKASQQKRPVVLGPEKEVKLKGDCARIRNATFELSDWNKQYDQVINTIQKQKNQQKSLALGIQRSAKKPEDIQNYEEAIKHLVQEKQIYIDSMMGVNPFLGKLAAINAYGSFAADKKNYSNELDHYGFEYFADVPLEDPTYDHLTFLFEAFREYAGILGKTNAPPAIINKYIDHTLGRIREDRHAFKVALGGIVLGLQPSTHPSYLVYGERFVNKYKKDKTKYVETLAQQLEVSKALQIGGEAPNISAKTPEGVDMSLSDLRGKYVLIDFWASWCGPCRKENPNVVKAYSKYAPKGFEILGVSLDNKKERWLGAIEKDGLTWPQISDLKGWQSGPAGTYNVRSIPATVLLDKEGIIIARNLRGAQLEMKLQEIFGN